MSKLQERILDIATRDLCDSVMRHESLGLKQALKVVYSSRLYSLMADPGTGLYREGPVYLYDMLCEERGIACSDHTMVAVPLASARRERNMV